jgi:hypothetical protein
VREVSITKEQLKIAQTKADEMGRLNNSIKNGEGNVAGFLGELVVADCIGAEVNNTYDYDLKKGLLTFDVKTKLCTSKPKPEYECSVAAFNISQKCDYYVFVRVLEDYSKAWVLGEIAKEDYYKQARFCRKGLTDSKSHIGWKFKADCYNLEISKLREI